MRCCGDRQRGKFRKNKANEKLTRARKKNKKKTGQEEKSNGRSRALSLRAAIHDLHPVRRVLLWKKLLGAWVRVHRARCLQSLGAPACSSSVVVFVPQTGANLQNCWKLDVRARGVYCATCLAHLKSMFATHQR